VPSVHIYWGSDDRSNKKSDIYFLVVDHLCTEEQWLSAAGVRPKSPAEGIAARVYSCIFGGLTDVAADYETYYQREYRDLWNFLYWHYMIDDDTLEEIRRVFKSSQRLFYGDIDDGGDYNLGQYIMSDEGFPVVKHILAKIYKERKA
jgi:hypothetical protein